ncbi:SH3 domain-containing protein [Domibacillus tundrae]|uniref:SH3 domain-containing protein n=1 Tax=Domibacillus tundrae TaxID=1587527 RepID=UPI00061822D9|nr:SH3 domain-containing protein [Domibacillus tundrae]
MSLKRVLLMLATVLLILCSQSNYISINVAAATNKGTVTVSTLDVKEKPSPKAKKVGILKKGAVVEVYGTKPGGWSEIRYNKKVAFVATSGLQLSTTVSTNSYKPDPKKIYTYMEYELKESKKIDISYITKKYNSKSQGGEVWDHIWNGEIVNQELWKEDSKGLYFNGADMWEKYLTYPVKKGNKWTVGDDWYKREIISTNETVTVKAGTFRNCVVVDYNYQTLTFVKGIGLIKVVTRGDFGSELASIKDK